MILIYIDETGDTGTNFKDPQQPVFVLGAMLVEEEGWQILEKIFESTIQKFFKNEIPENFELHTMDLIGRRGFFKGFSLEETCSLRDELFNIIERFNLPIIYRKVDKKKYDTFCQEHYGEGIKINPYIMALPFICLTADEILKDKEQQGILIFDQHKESINIENSLKTLRLDLGSTLKTKRLIEKGFFVDSSKSYPIQLIDFILYYIRKYEEFKIGKKVSSIHQQVFPMVEKITESLDRHKYGRDILDWIKSYID